VQIKSGGKKRGVPDIRQEAKSGPRLETTRTELFPNISGGFRPVVKKRSASDASEQKRASGVPKWNQITQGQIPEIGKPQKNSFLTEKEEKDSVQKGNVSFINQGPSKKKKTRPRRY